MIRFSATTDVRRQPTAIQLMADYQCHPLWDMTTGQYRDIDPADLPLSDELKRRLREWARLYDETLNMETPQDSGFKSEELEREFRVEGHRLAECLRNELGPTFAITEKI